MAFLYRSTLLTCIACIAGFASQAEVHFRVKNCTDHEIPYWTFDGFDSIQLIQSDNGTLPAFSPATDADTDYHTLKCGAGSRCQFYMAPSDFFGKTFKHKVKKNAYMRIISLEEFKYDVPAIAAREGTQYLLHYTVSTNPEPCSERVEYYSSLTGQ